MRVEQSPQAGLVAPEGHPADVEVMSGPRNGMFGATKPSTGGAPGSG